MRVRENILVRFSVRITILFALMSALGAIVAVCGFLLFGFDALLVVLVAWGVCTVAALLGHALHEYPQGDAFLMHRMVSSMIVRTGIPLVAIILCNASAPGMFSKTFVILVVCFYLVGLALFSALNIAGLKGKKTGDSQTLPLESNTSQMGN